MISDIRRWPWKRGSVADLVVETYSVRLRREQVDRSSLQLFRPKSAVTTWNFSELASMLTTLKFHGLLTDEDIAACLKALEA